MKNRMIWLLSLLLIVCCFGTARADTAQTIFATNQSQSPAEQEWKFNVAPLAAKQQVRLSLDARIDWPNLAGSNPWMRVAVNGNFLTKDQLLNKHNEFKVRSGMDMTWAIGDRWRVLYSPNFEDAIKDTDNPMAAPNDDPYHFAWDITQFVKPGANVLKIYNLNITPKPTTMVLRNALVEVGAAIAPPSAKAVTPAQTASPTTKVVTPAPTTPTAPSSTSAPGVSENETIFATNQSQSPAEQEWKFNVTPFSVEHQVRLSLDARIDWPSLAGSNPWLRVAVNGNFLTKDRLLNKRNEFKMTNGWDLSWTNDDRWRIIYSPNFEDAITKKDEPMAIPNDDPYHFVWDITNLVKPGENVLKLYNLKVIPEPTTMILRNARIEVGHAIAPPADYVVTPAPTGPLPTFVASEKTRDVPMHVALAADGGLTLTVAGEQYAISTRTSLPDGKWRETATASAAKNGKDLSNGQTASTSWKTDLYNVKREVKVLSDHVHIADTLTNPGKELVGVMVEHHLQYPSAPQSLLVAGLMARPGTASSMETPEHPSVFAQWPDVGLGLIAEDDIFRVHIKSFNDNNGMGLADEQLGIAPGAAVTLEWNIYPLPHADGDAGDYWNFVNTVRRNWGSNITIPGPFAFVPRFNEDDPLQDSSEPAAWYANWMHERGLKILGGNIGRYPDAKYAHGTGILSSPLWVEAERKFVEKLHEGMPDAKYLSYFHAQISTEPNGETKYADSRLLDDKGQQLSYPGAKLPLYLPTLDNSYGKALWKVIHTDLDTIKADGLYWDEMNWSMLRYADSGPWDNHTVIIDPQTHAVTGKRSNVTLLMQPLQLEVVRYLREHGKSIIANTEPVTRTMLNQKIVRFVETQSYVSLINTHFGTPVGLGNHFDEKDQADTARQIRDLLGYGAVYYADTQYKRIKPPTWPFVSVMFPITPMEILPGMVLGKERIQTATSGNFGWPDGAAADIYVIDGNGNRVVSPPVKDVGKDGHHLYEIRMPSDNFAVLVKK